MKSSHSASFSSEDPLSRQGDILPFPTKPASASELDYIVKTYWPGVMQTIELFHKETNTPLHSLPATDHQVIFHGSRSPLMAHLGVAPATITKEYTRVVRGVKQTLHDVTIDCIELNWQRNKRDTSSLLYMPAKLHGNLHLNMGISETKEAKVAIPGNWSNEIKPSTTYNLEITRTRKQIQLVLIDAFAPTKRQAYERASEEMHYGILYPTED